MEFDTVEELVKYQEYQKKNKDDFYVETIVEHPVVEYPVKKDKDWEKRESTLDLAIEYGTLKQREVRKERVKKGLCQYCGHPRERKEVKYCNKCKELSMARLRKFYRDHTTPKKRKSDRKYFQYEARVIWEKAHGRIPKGYSVYHKDRNVKNNSLNNLKLMSKSELFQINILNAGKKWKMPKGYRKHISRHHKGYSKEEIEILKKYVHLSSERGIKKLLAKKLKRTKNSISNALYRIKTGELK